MGANASVYQWRCEECSHINPTEQLSCVYCHAESGQTFHWNPNIQEIRHLGKIYAAELLHPPVNFKCEKVTWDTVTLTWQPPEDSDTNAVLVYLIEQKEQTENSWRMVRETKMTDCCIENLVQWKRYSFRISAFTKSGQSPFNEIIIVSVPEDEYDRPGQMDPPEILEVWKDQCLVIWKSPSRVGASAIIAYYLKRSPAEYENWTLIKCLKKEEFSLKYLDQSLEKENQYLYRICAENRHGVGPTSNSSQIVIAEDPLIAPCFSTDCSEKTITMKIGTEEKLTLPFTGSPVPEVTWTYNGKSLTVSYPTDEKVKVETKDCSTCLSLSNVRRSDSGLYCVNLVNGCGSCSMIINVQIFDTPSGVGTPVVIEDVKGKSCKISWKAASETGGARILGYYVFRIVAGSSRMTKINSQPVSACSFVDSDLQKGNHYQYRVAAINKMGTGPPSPLSEQFIAASLPVQSTSSVTEDMTNESILDTDIVISKQNNVSAGTLLLRHEKLGSEKVNITRPVKATFSYPREFSSLSRVQWPSDPDITTTRQSNVSVEDVRFREEKKALEKLNTIRTICKKKKMLFTDPSFPAKPTSLYYNPKSLRKSKENALWLRPSKIKQAEDDRKLEWAVVRSPNVNDIVQGLLGNCWFLSCLAVIAERSDLIEKVLTSCREFCPEGVYIVTLCNDGAWTNIIIDDLLPCDKNDYILYSRSKRRQLWVPLLEKAFAKIYGCYEAIEAGSLLEGLSTLTGAPCEIIDLNISDEKDVDFMWYTLLESRSKSYLMGGACGGYRVEQSRYAEMGLVYAHAYSLLDVQEVEGIRLVQLRNPWGHFSWKGDYSDDSLEWANISTENIAKLNPTGNKQGIFWMPLSEFMRYFDWVDVCKYRPEWMETRIAGSFPRDLEGSFRITVIEVFQTTETDFTLFQESHRKQAKESRYCADLFIIVLEGDYFESKKFGRLVGTSRREIEKSTGFALTLDSGIYTVVCMAFNHLEKRKQPLKYILTIHSEHCIMRDTHRVESQVIPDALIKLAVHKGKVKQDPESKGTKVYCLTQGWLGAVFVGENRNANKNMHVTLDCSNSVNLISSRGSLKASDVIKPGHRQVLMVLTAPKKSRFVTSVTMHQKLNSSGGLIEFYPDSLHNPPLPKGLQTLHEGRLIVDD